ncbi:MAG: DMT family transporter [Pirellulaceae bacterium]
MGYGEVMAMGAAACWALSSVIYARARLSAWTINFAKNVLGAILVFLNLWLLWLITGQGFLVFSGQAWFYLVISGLIGIALGDTCYFRSLQILGPRRSLVVATTAPVFGAVFGWMWLDEILSPWSMIGIVIAITGIGMVVMEKRARVEAPDLFPGKERTGVLLGLVAAVCQAAGGAISKLGMRECSALEATFVRLLAAVVVAVIIFGATRRLKSTVQDILKRDNFKKLMPAAALGTWLGIWFSQIGFKYADVAIATMLMSTSPLFAIPLIRIFDGHSISLRAVIWTAVAIVGITVAIST